MRVFLSWSGERSKSVATLLRDNLRLFLQSIDPWMSAEDIDKGARWGHDVTSQLNETAAGIICLTSENLDAPWIHFEAGALSKTMERTLVTPYLVGVDPADVRGPLVQFQSTVANKADTLRLIQTLNKAAGDAKLDERIVNQSFEAFWPALEAELAKIPQLALSKTKKRSDRELLEEILETVRNSKRDERGPAVTTAAAAAGLTGLAGLGVAGLTGLGIPNAISFATWAALKPETQAELTALGIAPTLSPWLRALVGSGAKSKDPKEEPNKGPEPPPQPDSK